jgi:hypothetical protein
MRSLGEFFGHVAQGVRTPAVGGGAGIDAGPVAPSVGPPAAGVPAAAPERRVVRETVEEEERETPQGKVTLRRTIIEEVELPHPPPPGGSGQ